jgi:hypothetical protein
MTVCAIMEASRHPRTALIESFVGGASSASVWVDGPDRNGP